MMKGKGERNRWKSSPTIFEGHCHEMRVQEVESVHHEVLFPKFVLTMLQIQHIFTIHTVTSEKKLKLAS